MTGTKCPRAVRDVVKVHPISSVVWYSLAPLSSSSPSKVRFTFRHCHWGYLQEGVYINRPWVCILIDHGVQTVCTHYSGWYTVDRMYISPYMASTIHLYDLKKVGIFQFFDWKEYLGRNPSSINPWALFYYNHLILHFPFLIMVSDVHIYQIHTHIQYTHTRDKDSLHFCEVLALNLFPEECQV